MSFDLSIYNHGLLCVIDDLDETASLFTVKYVQMLAMIAYIPSFKDLSGYGNWKCLLWSIGP